MQTYTRSAGPWLTLLHTLATNSSLWDDQIAQLAQEYRLVLIDMRGHGASDASDHQTSIQDLARDVVAVWDALEIDQSSVVGLSIGGMIALSLAIDHADRITTIVAAGCRARSSDQFRSLWEGRRKVLGDGGMQALVEPTLPTWLTQQALEEQPELVSRVTAMILATSVIGYEQATRALEQLDLFDQLGKIDRPVLLLVGEQDGPHPAEMAAINEQIGTSQLIMIPQCSHLINLEQPAPFTAAIRQFLSQSV